MASTLNLTPVHAPSIPDCFLLPADQLRPATAAVSLPVVDMSCDRDEVRRAILDSGLRQGVVNHSISEQAMRDMEAVCHEFFQMPAEDKAEFYSEDESIRNRLFSGSSFETLGEKYWLTLREVVGNYTGLARGLAMEILQLLCEGLGLRPDFFVGDISGGRVVVDINYYPPCPDPSRTLGLPPHCDRDLMTILLPGAVPGLDIAYKGGWIKVLPVPNSIIINFGLQLEVVTNGLLRGVEHRASTNSVRVPTNDCVVGPAEEFVSEDNHPRYRTLTVGEFKRKHIVVNLGSSINQVADLENIQKVM
ncbi:hypothetical protein SETIT_3G089000v2 [Setaria italica]|uniref:Fe2OG dioxygenase domain-containing protein n=1 Tax=Setaria italica TaxID=4555 RepID=A0A368QCW5_SETIT|nr:hypothetical protein SETIT_3G089000v2 [Setaria italica]